MKDFAGKSKIVTAVQVGAVLVIVFFTIVALYWPDYRKATELTHHLAILQQLGGDVAYRGVKSERTYAFERFCGRQVGIDSHALQQDSWLLLRGADSFDGFLRTLPPWENVRDFRFFDAEITTDTISSLLKQRQLRWLKFENCTFAIDDLAMLSQLPSLERVELSGHTVTDDLIDIVLPTGVSSLALQGTSVTEAGISKLRQMENLVELHLEDVTLSKRYIQELLMLPHLRNLDLQNATISSDAKQDVHKLMRFH